MVSRSNGKKYVRRAMLFVAVAFFLFAFLQPTHAQTTEEACEAANGAWVQNSGVWYCASEGTVLPGGAVAGSTSGVGGESACNSIGSCIAYVIYIFTAGLGSGAAYIGAWFLNLAVYASLQSVAYALDFISAGWTQVRDLANMAFIFILIYIAFIIMLKADTSGTMQTLARVIVIALLINFSFFLTRVVIDAGNIIAVQFYNTATANAPTIGHTATGADAAVTNAVRVGQAVTNTFGLTNNANIYDTKDLTAGIMSAINVQGILGSDSFIIFQEDSNWATEAITLSFVYLAVGVILFMLAAIFLSVGVRFIVRIVILWLAIIASPLALIMRTMKQTEKYYYIWQNALITQTFYPAIFLFLFIIITGFAYAISGCAPGQVSCEGITGSIFGSLNTQDASAGGFATLAAIIANVAIKLGFIVVLLYFALQISNKVSGFGGQIAHTISTAPGKWAMRAGGFAFQQTGGRFASRINTSLANSRRANQPGLLGWAGYQARGQAQKVAGASVGGARSFSQFVKDRDTRTKEQKGNLWNIENKDQIKRLGDLEEKQRKTGILSATEEAERQKIVDRVNRFGKSDLEAFKSKDLERIVRVLKEDQIKKVKDSDKYTNVDIEKLENAWHGQSNDAPLKKANKQIELLRQINETLKNGARPVTVAEIDRRIGTKAAPTHDVIDSVAIDEMKTDITKEISKVRSEIAATPRGTPTVELQQNLHNLQDAVRKMEKLEDEMKKIPPKVGGVDKAGSFDTSHVK